MFNATGPDYDSRWEEGRDEEGDYDSGLLIMYPYNEEAEREFEAWLDALEDWSEDFE